MPTIRTHSPRRPNRLVGLSVAVLSVGLLGGMAPVRAREGRARETLGAPVGSLPCVGDCNGDSMVTVDELVFGVGLGLGRGGLDRCPAFDFFADGAVTIDELLLSVAASNEGCAPAPTPTATPGAVTLAEVQEQIFTPRCAVISCHANPFPAAGLILEEGESFATLVGQTPNNPTAESLGLLRVDPGNPDNSFLLIKVEGPDSPDLGTRMPQRPPDLTPTQIELIRDWIAGGANQ